MYNGIPIRTCIGVYMHMKEVIFKQLQPAI